MIDIYELSEYQFNLLKELANNEHEPVIVVDLLPTDVPAFVEKNEKRRSEILDLVTLGLVEDRSKVMVDAVIGFKLKAGRGASVYYASEFGRIMFAYSGKKKKLN